MEEEILQNIPSLPPNKYPAWIKLFTGVLLLSVVYSLILLPEYFVASKKFKAGLDAYNSRDYLSSIKNLEYSLKTVPTSKKVKIAIAKAYFANGNQQDDEKGLDYLQGVTLDKETWVDLTTVMPVEYQKYFNDIKQ
jgi:hypothetical protein